jgi:hypothetical protein
MIEPPGLFNISGSAARVTRSTPSTLVCNIVSQSSSLPSATVSSPSAPPALLIRTSSLPLFFEALIFSAAHFMNSFTLEVLLTSSE